VAEFDTEPCEGCKRIDDEATAIAGVVVTIVGIGIRLDRAVDADRVCDSFVFSPGVRLADLGAGRASQKAQPASVCCITVLLRRRRERRSSLDGRPPVGESSRMLRRLARGRERVRWGWE